MDFIIAAIGMFSVFACVALLVWGIVSLIRKKKSKKYFLLSLLSFVIFVSLAVFDTNREEAAQEKKEAQMQKEREARIEKKKVAKTASTEVEKPTFSFVEASAIVLKMKEKDVDVNDDINRYDFIKTSVMKGYLATKMKDHVYTFADVDKSGEWTRVTFSDDNKKVIKVEMSPNLEKKAIAFNNKEADKNKEKATETAKKEEAQKKADEQKQAELKKQEEAKKLEEQKAQEEAQAKAAEEKRKQEEAARIAEEKRVAEQKQKEQEALQAKQQAEAEQARKEAEEKAQAEAQQQTQTATFQNCSEVRAAGRAPIRQGEPGFQAKFDRDGDGIGCDQ
ncbi:excalibur calcium-binding domain-containing protein [Priestia megaterium]